MVELATTDILATSSGQAWIAVGDHANWKQGIELNQNQL